MTPYWPSLAVLVPLLAAGVLAALPRLAWAGRLNFGAAALGLGVACSLPWAAGASGDWLRATPLAIHLVVLGALAGAVSAWGQRGAPARQAALFQCVLGSTALALLADNIVLTWVGSEGAALAMVAATARHGSRLARQVLLLLGGAVVLAAFGTLLLYLAARPALGDGREALSWTALAQAAAQCDSPLLSMAFVLLLLGYGGLAGLVPLQGWLPAARGAWGGALAGALPAVGVAVLLRLRGVLEANAHALSPGGPLLALGLATAVLAAGGMWRRQGTGRALALSSAGQHGVAVAAFGLGGAAATFAGLLHFTTHVMAKSAAVQVLPGGGPQRHPVHQVTLGAALVALAGLPPFGLFTSSFLVLQQAVLQSPLVAVPLAAAMAGSALALLRHMPSVAKAGVGGALPGAWAAAWVALAAALLLGLAMPPALAAWLQGIVTVAQ